MAIVTAIVQLYCQLVLMIAKLAIELIMVLIRALAALIGSLHSRPTAGKGYRHGHRRRF